MVQISTKWKFWDQKNKFQELQNTRSDRRHLIKKDIVQFRITRKTLVDAAVYLKTLLEM